MLNIIGYFFSISYMPMHDLLKENLSYEEVPIQILDHKEQVLCNKTIHLVKVLWWNHSIEEASWERKDEMQSKYPQLFQN